MAGGLKGGKSNILPIPLGAGILSGTILGVREE